MHRAHSNRARKAAGFAGTLSAALAALVGGCDDRADSGAQGGAVGSGGNAPTTLVGGGGGVVPARPPGPPGSAGSAGALPSTAADAGVTNLPDPDGTTNPPPGTGGAPPTLDGAAPFVPPPLAKDACGATGVSILTRAAAGPAGPRSIAADAEYVYYDDPGCVPGARLCPPAPGPLRRIPRCGGEPEVLVPRQQLVRSLQDGGAVVYAVGYADGVLDPPRLERIHKDTRAIDHFPAPDFYASSTRDFVYAVPAVRQIMAIGVDAAAPRLLGNVAVSPVALAATEQSVFWSDGEDFWRASIDGAWAPELLGHAASQGSSVALFPAGDASYAVIGPTLFSLPASGNAVSSRPFANPFKQWLAGEVYYETNYWGSGTGRTSFVDDRPEEILLREGTLGVVSDGMMYWAAYGYVLRRAAVPENVEDPYDPVREKAELEVPTPLQMINSISARPGGGFVVTGIRASTVPGPDIVLDTPFIRFYSDSGAEQPPLPIPGDMLSGLAVDDAGNFTTVEGGPGQRSWARYDTSGQETGRGALPFDVVLLAGGATGRFALYTSSALDAPLVELRSANGALVKSVPAGSGAIASVAVAPNDHVLVAGGARPADTYFGKTATEEVGYVASLAPDGSIEWVMSAVGLTVDKVAAVPAGGVVFLGHGYGAYTVGQEATVAVPGRVNAVVGRLDASGAVVSLRSFEGGGARLGVDARGNAVVGGYASDRTFVDLMAPAEYGARTRTGFVARFDVEGTLVSVDRSDASTVTALGLTASGAAIVAFDGHLDRFAAP